MEGPTRIDLLKSGVAYCADVARLPLDIVLALFLTLLDSAMGLFGFTVENTTLCSVPWKYEKSFIASFEFYPEQKGNTFLAFKGGAHHGHEYWTQTEVMVKAFRTRPGTATDCDRYLDAAKEARNLANKFNTEAEALGCKQKVMFVRPTSVVMDDRSDITPILSKLMRFKKTFAEDEYVVFEELIKGKFSTFVSSFGQATGNGSAILDAFCHYTYHQSNGEYVVCNLQGVKEDDIFRLTNPTIHSRSDQYGPNDKGDKGIADFFANHVCNGGICGDFIRPDVDCKSSVGCSDTSGSQVRQRVDKYTSPPPYTSRELTSSPPPYALVDPQPQPTYDGQLKQT